MNYDIIALSKIASLLLFMPMFVGIAIWAYWPGNKAMFDDLAAMPLRDD